VRGDLFAARRLNPFEWGDRRRVRAAGDGRGAAIRSRERRETVLLIPR
jgi:hypothetical protein